jgi:hypothetical protein
MRSLLKTNLQMEERCRILFDFKRTFSNLNRYHHYRMFQCTEQIQVVLIDATSSQNFN